jgi:ABC-type multidrug transport system fused ATPase/permease subunit
MIKSLYSVIRSFSLFSNYKLWTSIAISVATTSLIVPVGVLVKMIFDEAVPQSNLSLLLVLGFVAILLIILSSVFSVIARTRILKLTKNMVLELRSKLTQKILCGSHTFYQQADLSKIHKVMVYDTEKIDNLSNSLFTMIIPSGITGLCIIGILFSLDWQTSIILCFLGVVTSAANERLRKACQKNLMLFQIAFQDFHRRVWFVLEANQLIKTSSSQVRESAIQQKIMQSTTSSSLAMATGFAKISNYQDLIFSSGSILLLMLGGYRVMQSSMTLGSLLSFYFCLFLLKRHVNNVTAAFPMIMEGADSLARCHELLSQIDIENHMGKKRPDFSGKIVLSNVSFSFHNETLFENINLQLTPGKITLLTGANGSGKSTLINLILGFYHPVNGSLYAEEIPYQDIDMFFLRTRISVVFQENIIFNGTIRDNINYMNLEARPEEIAQAIRLANLGEFIQQLPEGMETLVGENGVRLSGGQRQKLALARCFLNESPLIILDEPTNHLDDNSIARIMSAVKNLKYHPAILLVSHDPKLADYADHVYSLSNNNEKIFT